MTARSVGGRTILNHKAYQNKVKSAAQCSSRNTLSKVSRPKSGEMLALAKFVADED